MSAAVAALVYVILCTVQ